MSGKSRSSHACKAHLLSRGDNLFPAGRRILTKLRPFIYVIVIYDNSGHGLPGGVIIICNFHYFARHAGMYICAYLAVPGSYELAQTDILAFSHQGLSGAAQRNIHSFGRGHDLYGLIGPDYSLFLLAAKRMNTPSFFKHKNSS